MRVYKVASPHVISEDAAGETVVINLDTGSYYNLNAPAGQLWSVLVQGVDLDALTQGFAKEAADAANIEAFLARLIEEGLIVPASAAGVTTPQGVVDTNNLVLEVYTDMQELLGLDPIHEVKAEEGWPVQQAAPRSS